MNQNKFFKRLDYFLFGKSSDTYLLRSFIFIALGMIVVFLYTMIIDIYVPWVLFSILLIFSAFNLGRHYQLDNN